MMGSGLLYTANFTTEEGYHDVGVCLVIWSWGIALNSIILIAYDAFDQHVRKAVDICRQQTAMHEAGAHATEAQLCLRLITFSAE